MEAQKAKVNREFKDGMFRTLFNDKDNGVVTICESRLMELLMQPVHRIVEDKLAMNRLHNMP